MTKYEMIKKVAEREQVHVELIDAIVYDLGILDDNIRGISINGSVLTINGREYLITKDYDEAVELAEESMFELVNDLYGNGMEISEAITNELINIIEENIDLSEYAIEGDDGEEYVPNDIWELVEEYGYDKLSLIRANATSRDYQEIAEDLVYIEGAGKTLALYDGIEIELINGSYLFRTD